MTYSKPTSPTTQVVSPSTVSPPQQGGALHEKQAYRGQYVSQETSAPAEQMEDSQGVPVPSPVIRGESGASQTSDPDLRREFEDLRREVILMRQERGLIDEAPPLYDADLEDSLRH